MGGGSKFITAVTAVMVCLTVLSHHTVRSAVQQCGEPEWDETAGPNPMTSRRGKVVLVAMLKGYCWYCVRQAEKMELLKDELASEGYTDIDMLIINGGEARSRDQVSNLVEASSIPVIQDTSDHVLYRQVFGANKDDFLVFDRCTQAAIYIPSPWSNLNSSVTKHVLKAVHEGNHNCYCSLDNAEQTDDNTDNASPADDPETGSHNQRKRRSAHTLRREQHRSFSESSSGLESAAIRAVQTRPFRGSRRRSNIRRRVSVSRRLPSGSRRLPSGSRRLPSDLRRVVYDLGRFGGRRNGNVLDGTMPGRGTGNRFEHVSGRDAATRFGVPNRRALRRRLNSGGLLMDRRLNTQGRSFGQRYGGGFARRMGEASRVL